MNRTPDIYVFAKDYVQPLTWQWSLNLERQLGKDYSLTVGYLGVRGEPPEPHPRYQLPSRSAAAGDLRGRNTGHVLRHPGRANPAFGRISLFDSGADSIYHGGFVQLSKRFSQHFQVQTSYTFSKVIDSRPDFTSVVVGTDDSKNAQDTLAPNLERGRGNADITHRFVFSGVWDIDYAQIAAEPGRAQSPARLSVLGDRHRTERASAYGDGRAEIRTGTRTHPPTGLPMWAAIPTPDRTSPPRTSGLPAISRCYGDRVSLRLMFEAFNVTNRANFNSINSAQYNFTAATRVFTPNATFLAPTSTYDPRILQLAAKIRF